MQPIPLRPAAPPPDRRKAPGLYDFGQLLTPGDFDEHGTGDLSEKSTPEVDEEGRS